jgi:hypothetical protein
MSRILIITITVLLVSCGGVPAVTARRLPRSSLLPARRTFNSWASRAHEPGGSLARETLFA